MLYLIKLKIKILYTTNFTISTNKQVTRHKKGAAVLCCAVEESVTHSYYRNINTTQKKLTLVLLIWKYICYLEKPIYSSGMCNELWRHFARSRRCGKIRQRDS